MKSVFFGLKIATMALAINLTDTIVSNKVYANTDRQINIIKPRYDRNPQPLQKNFGVCPSNLTEVIDKIIEKPELWGSKWGIIVQSLSGSTLYSKNPDSYMIPASNIKLLVTAAALQILNPDRKFRSSSVRSWVTSTNMKSHNNYANLLLRFLGGYGSLVTTLNKMGISSNGYRMADGSGLSRKNLATPRTFVNTLKAMYFAPGHDIFLASLPIAGETGTLRHRLRYTNAQGTVRAKTGTLKGVRALSGYVENTQYGTLVFSAIANQPRNHSDYRLVKALDEIVVSLSSLSNCQFTNR